MTNDPGFNLFGKDRNATDTYLRVEVIEPAYRALMKEGGKE